MILHLVIHGQIISKKNVLYSIQLMVIGLIVLNDLMTKNPNQETYFPSPRILLLNVVE
jgi:hypothetical protein